MCFRDIDTTLRGHDSRFATIPWSRYVVLKALFAELAEMFEDEYIHIGW